MRLVKELAWSNGREWGLIYCPMLDREVMTYWEEGTPCYDTYTAPMVSEDGEIFCYRFDQDEGAWFEDVYLLGEYDGVETTCRFA